MGRYHKLRRGRYSALREGRWGMIRRGRWAGLVMDQNSGKVEPLGRWSYPDPNDAASARFRLATYKTEQAALKAASRKAGEGQTVGAATLKKGQTIGVLEL